MDRLDQQEEFVLLAVDPFLVRLFKHNPKFSIPNISCVEIVKLN